MFVFVADGEPCSFIPMNVGCVFAPPLFSTNLHGLSTSTIKSVIVALLLAVHDAAVVLPGSLETLVMALMALHEEVKFVNFASFRPKPRYTGKVV